MLTAMSMRIAYVNDERRPAGHSSHPGGGSFVPNARKSYLPAGGTDGLGASVAVGVSVGRGAPAVDGATPLPHGLAMATRSPATTTTMTRRTWRWTDDE